MDEPTNHLDIGTYPYSSNWKEPTTTHKFTTNYSVRYRIHLYFHWTSNKKLVETIDALIDALRGYKGGVVIVSHDQHFVNSICSELWVVADQKVTQFRGSMAEYKKAILKE